MIKKRYKRIQHPAPDVYIYNGKGTHTVIEMAESKNSMGGKPRGQLFPSRWPPGYPK